MGVSQRSEACHTGSWASGSRLCRIFLTHHSDKQKLMISFNPHYNPVGRSSFHLRFYMRKFRFREIK